MFGKLGGWKVNVVTGAMPQKVATAISELANTLLGATYEPIAYLGSQVANGTNHAVLAKQTIVAGVDVKNIVVLKFNEKGMNCSLYAVEPIIQEGATFGGYAVDVKVGKDIPEEAKAAFDKVTGGMVGSNIQPVALLATKVVKGINYAFIATVAPVVANPEANVQIVTVNSLVNSIDFDDVL